jgi:hypothetical protein
MRGETKTSQIFSLGQANAAAAQDVGPGDPTLSGESGNALVNCRGAQAFRLRFMGNVVSVATTGAGAENSPRSIRYPPFPVMVERLGVEQGDQFVILYNDDFAPTDGASQLRICPSQELEAEVSLACDYRFDLADSPLDVSCFQRERQPVEFELPFLTTPFIGDASAPALNTDGFRVFPWMTALRLGGMIAGNTYVLWVKDPSQVGLNDGTGIWTIGNTFIASAQMEVFDLEEILGGGCGFNASASGLKNGTQISRLFVQGTFAGSGMANAYASTRIEL